MRINAVFFGAMLAGCAGQPPAAPPSVAPPATIAPVPVPETHRVKVDASNVVAVQQAGYKLVTKDGEPLYCRTDPITGSRIQTRTTCLTEQELMNQMNATKHSLDSITSKQSGPSGH